MVGAGGKIVDDGSAVEAGVLVVSGRVDVGAVVEVVAVMLVDDVVTGSVVAAVTTTVVDGAVTATVEAVVCGERASLLLQATRPTAAATAAISVAARPTAVGGRRVVVVMVSTCPSLVEPPEPPLGFRATFSQLSDRGLFRLS